MVLSITELNSEIKMQNEDTTRYFIARKCLFAQPVIKRNRTIVQLIENTLPDPT